eukprot:TRINITY_DN4422_c0_g1_i2.p1 TRINITY_DN4422_c0_g1~~TRINITY_DN4422_c0_g1_i2.p1  ORF type:complete len:266 (+),score=43.25 TRINITY_DN4422_c0_g1_i2:500-1297(+)
MAMGFKLCILLLACCSSFVLGCDRCVYYTKLAYYSNAGAVNVGACGYGSFASKLYSGNVAAATSKIYRDGIACGACYQMRCTNQTLCTKNGAEVVVTDHNWSNQTGFVVTPQTFSSLAVPGKGKVLLQNGIVDIEYKRIPCEYGNENMKVKVLESSQYPYYLSVQFLMQGGQTDITAVDVAKVGTSDWHFLSRNYGSVWDIRNPPKGDLQFRFLVTSGYDGKWIWAKKRVLPSDWKASSIYDTGIQISDIAQEGCNPCNDTHWKK